MNNASLLEKMMVEVHKDMSVMIADIAAIKTDLKEHMRRTAVNETKLQYLQKQVFMAQGAVAFIGTVATILGLWKLLH